MSQINIYVPPEDGRPSNEAQDPSTAPLNAAGIVVCRLDSSRLPGKVLRTVQNRPLLKWVIDRIQQVTRLDRGVVVATSNRTIDDPIHEFCREHQIPVYRGAADDVAGRVLNCALKHGVDWFARINADSPFLEPELLDRACTIAASNQFDLVTNLSPRSFPYGVSTELIRTSTFRQAYARMSSPEHYEHVTKLFYEKDNPIDYRKYNILNTEPDQSHIRLTVDTPADWQLFCRIAESGDRSVTYRKAIQLIQPTKGAA